MSERSFVVIPARLNSTRLPQKLLLRETGKPLIQHTYESACKASLPAGVCVATDHESIVQTVNSFGGMARMTSENAASGTDRVAEVAREMTDVGIFVNVQGDEPEISAQAIDHCLQILEDSSDASIATLATPVRSVEQLQDPSCVKVVFDRNGRALYFSRSPIPYVRDWDGKDLADAPTDFYQHLGIYAYRRDFLLEFGELPSSELEQSEKLEQLRALSAGHTIVVGVVDEPTVGIDTRADYEAFVRRMMTC